MLNRSYNAKRVGPSIYPCGTPILTGREPNLKPFTLVIEYGPIKRFLASQLHYHKKHMLLIYFMKYYGYSIKSLSIVNEDITSYSRETYI